VLTLTKRTSYALIALSHLARHEQHTASSRQIAEHYSLPPALLTNVLKLLAKNGFVQSLRGSKGGYRLAITPSRVSLSVLISAIDGPVRLVECALLEGIAPDQPASACRVEDKCPVRGAVLRVNRKLLELLEQVTLSDVLLAQPLADGQGKPAAAPREASIGVTEV
jgi:Rrf2 family protein